MFVAIASQGNRDDSMPAHLARMAAALQGVSHRASAWLDPERAFGMAATTAGILPEDVFDSQPYSDDELVFACQARLDDRNDLARRLSIPALRSAELADSELVALAYKHWGDETPQHIYGDFTFVAWERAARRVVVACDHIGTLPLFYSNVGGKLLLATQLAALMAHPDAPRTPDMKALGMMVAPRLGLGWTMFENICHLPGGSRMVCEGGKTHIRQWWRPTTAAITRYRTDEDYVDDARSVFDAAVATRLRGTGEVATFLSGGLDSTLIASRAARLLAQQNRSIVAFTSVPEPGLFTAQRSGWDADDAPWARAVAGTVPNMVHRLVSPGDIVPPQIIPAIHRQSRTVVRNTANQVWLWKSADYCREHGIRIVLSGDRGNASISAVGAESLGHALRNGACGREMVRAVLAAGGIHPLRRWGCAILRQRDRFGHRKAIRLGTELLSAAFRQQHGEAMAPMKQLHQPRAEFVEFMMRPNKIALMDSVAHFGVQQRDPMGDRRLIELLLTFPLDAFRAGGRARGLARELGRDVLPEQVRLRQTRGAQCADEAAWFVAHEGLYRETFDAIRASTTAADILDIDRLAVDLDALFAGDGSHETPASVHRALDVGLFALAADSGAFAAGHAHGHMA